MRVPGPLDVLLGGLAGLLTLALFSPTSGQDSDPPKCWNAFRSGVPCDNAAWPVPFVLTVVLVTLVSWAYRSWRTSRNQPPVDDRADWFEARRANTH